MDFNELMAQRRSVRHFDPAAAIDRATLTALIDTANRAPSSNNSQPWRFHVITDQPLRAQLLPIAYGQQQVLSAAALVLVCADRDAYGVDNLRRIHQAQYENGRYDAALSGAPPSTVRLWTTGESPTPRAWTSACGPWPLCSRRGPPAGTRCP